MIPQVIQVYPVEDYQVYVYFATGEVRLYNAAPLLEKGVFKALRDPVFFKNRCTVINQTLAWDVTGTYDETQCLDLDPEVVYQVSQPVEDPLTDVG